MINNRSTDAVNFSDVYTDVNSIQSLKVTAGKDKRKALQEISAQFESMMMSMMLKSMRQANDVFSEGNPLVGKQEKFYRDMFDQQLGLNLGKSGSIGIAEAMYRQLEQTLPPEKSADAKTGNKTDATSINQTSTEMNFDHKTFLDEVRRIHKANPESPVSETATTANSVVPQGEVTTEEKFSEIDLWLSPNHSNTVDVADISRRDDYFDDEAASTLEFDGSPERFVQKLYRHAEKAAEAIGVDPQVLLAQAALETGWGQKLIQKQDGASSFNLFNIKAGKHWDGDYVTVPTLEYRDGIAVKEHAAFRSYSTPEESFADYVELINQNPRYKRAMQHAEDPKRYVRELERAGYATDPEYAEKIIDIMNSDSMKKTLGMLSNEIDMSGRG